MSHQIQPLQIKILPTNACYRNWTYLWAHRGLVLVKTLHSRIFFVEKSSKTSTLQSERFSKIFVNAVSPHYFNLIADLLKSYNKPYPWDIRMKVLGTTERKTCEIAVKEMQLPCTVDVFHKQFVKSCLQNLSNVHLLKGRIWIAFVVFTYHSITFHFSLYARFFKMISVWDIKNRLKRNYQFKL